MLSFPLSHNTHTLSQGLLLRPDKAPEAESLDQVVKLKNLPGDQQDSFKSGFTEGFMKSQAFTQRTQGTSHNSLHTSHKYIYFLVA